ncbi:hypothetical protein CEXT_370821 [Caerostris extrusa]|uniref:Uncharacterized protein n=1 Tax=Caerostris extrusa TaxID=172846 RepID=A0AAV4XFI8_CAEEX|nr:hypothetical protein CEXT_370821 [Caerostris extrusa]
MLVVRSLCIPVQHTRRPSNDEQCHFRSFLTARFCPEENRRRVWQEKNPRVCPATTWLHRPRRLDAFADDPSHPLSFNFCI